MNAGMDELGGTKDNSDLSMNQTIEITRARKKKCATEEQRRRNNFNTKRKPHNVKVKSKTHGTGRPWQRYKILVPRSPTGQPLRERSAGGQLAPPTADLKKSPKGIHWQTQAGSPGMIRQGDSEWSAGRCAVRPLSGRRGEQEGAQDTTTRIKRLRRRTPKIKKKPRGKRNQKDKLTILNNARANLVGNVRELSAVARGRASAHHGPPRWARERRVAGDTHATRIHKPYCGKKCSG